MGDCAGPQPFCVSLKMGVFSAVGSSGTLKKYKK